MKLYIGLNNHRAIPKASRLPYPWNMFGIKAQWFCSVVTLSLTDEMETGPSRF